jgi:hypothetical protein
VRPLKTRIIAMDAMGGQSGRPLEALKDISRENTNYDEGHQMEILPQTPTYIVTVQMKNVSAEESNRH